MSVNASTYLKSSDVARTLNVSQRTVTRYCRLGLFAGAFPIGKYWRIPESSVEQFVKQRQSGIIRYGLIMSCHTRSPGQMKEEVPAGSAFALEKHGAGQQAPKEGLSPKKQDSTPAPHSFEARKVISYAERCTPIDPCLAMVFGIGKAAILQQMSFLLSIANHDENHCFAGRIWVYNTYSQWHEQLPFIKRNTIEDHLKDLERQGVVLSVQRGSWNRVKHYTIAYEELDRIVMSDSRVQTFLASHAERRMQPTKNVASSNGFQRVQATSKEPSIHIENTKTSHQLFIEGVI